MPCDSPMNQDGVRVNRADLWTIFPSLRLLDVLRAPLALPVSTSSIAGLAILWLTHWLLEHERLRSVFILNQEWPATIARLIAEFERIIVLGSGAGFLSWMTVTVQMLITGMMGVAMSRPTSDVLNGRSVSLRTTLFIRTTLKAVLLSTSLTLAIAFTALLGFRAMAILTRLLSGISALSSLANVGFWILSLLMVVGGGVLFAGWMLSMASIGIDRCHGAEALSRGICYVLSRFRRFCVYSVVILLLAWISSATVWWLVSTAGHVAESSLSSQSGIGTAEPSGFIMFRWFLVEAWWQCVFLSGVAAIYLLLRQFEDNVDLVEVDGGKSFLSECSPHSPIGVPQP